MWVGKRDLLIVCWMKVFCDLLILGVGGIDGEVGREVWGGFVDLWRSG